jgi:uncharacterized protein YjbI with pentapeptide repeats
MAKRRVTPTKPAPPVLEHTLTGQTVCLAGNSRNSPAGALISKLVRLRGGDLLDEVDPELTYLIIGAAGSDEDRERAENLNAEDRSDIQILSSAEFLESQVPTPEEMLELLKGSPESLSLALELLQIPVSEPYDLSEVDLRGFQLEVAGVTYDLEALDLTDSDLREARLTNVWFSAMSGVNLDGATLAKCHFSGDCEFIEGSLKKGVAQGCDFSSCDIDQADFTSSDLSGSEFCSAFGANVSFRKTTLTDADFSQSELSEADLSGVDGTGLDFSGARLTRGLFTKSNLRGSVFCGANLDSADFTNCDLRDCDFNGANLNGVVWKGARLAGASFQLADLDQNEISKSADLASSDVDTGSQVNRHLDELREATSKISRVEFTLPFRRSGQRTIVAVTTSPKHVRVAWEQPNPVTGEIRSKLLRSSDLRIPLLTVVRRFREWEFLAEDVEVRSGRGPSGNRLPKGAVVQAICGVLGVAPPEDLLPMPASAAPPPPPPPKPVVQPPTPSELREQLLAALKSGGTAIARWNDAADDERDLVEGLSSQEFNGIDWQGINLRDRELMGTKLAKANLSGADLSYSILNRAQLKSARLDRATGWGTQLRAASLIDSSLVQTSLHCAFLNDANLRGANLSDAVLENCDLRGADFSTANLLDTVFRGSKIDEQTKWPKGFALTWNMVWAGSGPSPLPEPPPPPPEPPVSTLDAGDDLDDEEEEEVGSGAEETGDLAGFLDQLEEHVSVGKLDKALDLLQATPLELFFDLSQSSVSGVVRAPDDPDLAFCCHLSDDGAYGCCSSNLATCNGLRGSLCKHLLVLLVGLVQKGVLPADRAAQLVAASTENKPETDKELCSQSLERLESADRGGPVWKPVATNPEDFADV